jgi:O-antigen/teichoic acid export membrane protein
VSASPPGPPSPPDILATTQAGPAAIRGGALRVSGYMAGVLLSVLSAALLFRHLGVVQTGEYVTVLAIVTITSGLTDVGLTAIGVREYAIRDPVARDELMRSLLGMRVVLTSVGVAGAVAVAAALGYRHTVVVGTLLAGIGLVLQSLQTAFAVSLQARLRLGLVTATEVLRQLLTVLFIVALVLLGAELLPFLAITIPIGVIVLSATVQLVRGDVPLRPSFHLRAWGPLVRDTLPFALATAIGVVYFRVAIVILSVVSTGRETGYFGAAFRVLEVLVVVPQLVVGAAFPIFSRAARDNHARLAYGLQRVFDVCLALGGLLAVLVGVGAPVAIDVVASRPEFGSSVKMLQIQAPALLFSFAAAALNYALLSLRRHREVLWSVSVAFALSAALAGVLATSAGGDGAAVAVTLGELALAFGAFAALRLRHPELTPGLGALWRVLLAGGVALLPALAGLPAAPATALAGALYVGLLFALRGVPEELLVEVRRLRSRPPGPPA